MSFPLFPDRLLFRSVETNLVDSWKSFALPSLATEARRVRGMMLVK